MLNTILSSTNTGKSHYHIDEIVKIGDDSRDYKILGYFDFNGDRYYIAAFHFVSNKKYSFIILQKDTNGNWHSLYESDKITEYVKNNREEFELLKCNRGHYRKIAEITYKGHKIFVAFHDNLAWIDIFYYNEEKKKYYKTIVI